MAMSSSGCCPEQSDSGRLDPADFAREIRQLALDTYRGLTCPDSSVDELSALQRRFEDLLRQTQEPRTAELNRWLRSGDRAICARLHGDSSEDLFVRGTEQLFKSPSRPIGAAVGGPTHHPGPRRSGTAQILGNSRVLLVSPRLIARSVTRRRLPDRDTCRTSDGIVQGRCQRR